MDYDHLLFHPYALHSTMDIADYEKWWRETESPIEPLWDAPVHLTYSPPPPPPAINESDLAITYMEQLELDLAFDDFTSTGVQEKPEAAPCVVDVDTAQMQPAPAPTSVVDSPQVDSNSNSKKPEESDLAQHVDDEFMTLDDLFNYFSTEDQERAAPCVFEDPLIDLEPYCVDTAQKMPAPPSTMTVVNNSHDHVPAPPCETTLMLRADQVATLSAKPSAAKFQEQPCQTMPPVGNADLKRKRNPWTIEEHKLFLMGMKTYGDSEWKSIARDFVTTRTHIQIASHAQKYYKRREANQSCTSTNRKKRRSIHDLTID